MLEDTLAFRLAKLEKAGLRRRLCYIEGSQGPVVALDGREVLWLSSNNYLGLTNHPALKRAGKSALDRFGSGTGASRLISGSMALHRQLENRLADFKGTEAALLFPSGYQANLGIITALVGAGDTIFSDALNHASIIDGCRLSGSTVKVFRHTDLDHLEKLLFATSHTGNRLIVTDSVFSMDGDLAPLEGIVALARQHQAWVMVDEAHSTGVFGPNGAGLAEELNLQEAIEVQMGTLSKALGGCGAYLAGSRVLIEWVVNKARSFIYTTAPPPQIAATALAALDVLREEPQRRTLLWENAVFLTQGLRKLGYTLGDSRSPIIPLMIGDPERTVQLSAALLKRGVFAYGVRPPTVPEATARLRLVPIASHTRSQLEQALESFRDAGREVGILS